LEHYECLSFKLLLLFLAPSEELIMALHFTKNFMVVLYLLGIDFGPKVKVSVF